jgi:flagellar basal-body rod protein FlgF
VNAILSAAEAGMLNDVERLRIISHNLANVSTVGFKRELAVTRPFGAMLEASGVNSASVALARPIVASQTDWSPGALVHTGNPLDLALEGAGYFVIDTGAGEAYSRQGTFHLNSAGTLVNVGGQPVLTGSGEVRLTSPMPSIDARGNIRDGEAVVGQLRIVSVAKPESLRAIGNGMLLPTDASEINANDSVRVRQGYTEAANVASMNEMVKMIETVRHFETSQRLLLGYDAMLGRAITDLGSTQ